VTLNRPDSDLAVPQELPAAAAGALRGLDLVGGGRHIRQRHRPIQRNGHVPNVVRLESNTSGRTSHVLGYLIGHGPPMKSAAETDRKSRWRLRSGGLLQGDGVAEAFELRDEALDRFGGVAALEVVAAEAVVDLSGSQHVPAGDEDRVFDGAERLLVAAARA
jgi:hypothetical protein